MLANRLKEEKINAVNFDLSLFDFSKVEEDLLSGIATHPTKAEYSCSVGETGTLGKQVEGLSYEQRKILYSKWAEQEGLVLVSCELGYYGDNLTFRDKEEEPKNLWEVIKKMLDI